MKKTILALIAITGFCCQSLLAQPPQPPKPPSPEERLKKVSERLDKELHLTAVQKEKVLAAYKTFFADIEKNKSKNPPPPPPPVSKEVADKLSKERDAKIKEVLSAEQFKKYVEVEKTLRPKPPGNMPPPPDKKDMQ